MNKKKGIFTLIAFIVILAGLGYVSIFGVGENNQAPLPALSRDLTWRAASASPIRWLGTRHPAPLT